MAVINILDKSTAELIAAGEVVEKPASVVKELVENSIDAGAKNITVDIENGGIKKILVQDDGCGIDSEYVATAFIRHATSKISNKEDLDSISSLGFRGEALASIASVSKVTLTTKTDDQDFAVEYVIEGGEEKSVEIKPFIHGTRFIIRDLFYNTPARMKFLKKDATEAGYINEILTNLALSNPHISFTFKKDGKEVFITPGDGDLKNTIACLFTASFAKEICEVDYTDGKYSVKGFATYPHYSRQSRNIQLHMLPPLQESFPFTPQHFCAPFDIQIIISVIFYYSSCFSGTQLFRPLLGKEIRPTAPVPGGFDNRAVVLYDLLAGISPVILDSGGTT